MEGSYGTILPCGIRCSPCMKPWSEVKITYVLSSSPVARSLSMIFSTPSSTARRDSQRSWKRFVIAASRPPGSSLLLDVDPAGRRVPVVAVQNWIVEDEGGHRRAPVMS